MKEIKIAEISNYNLGRRIGKRANGQVVQKFIYEAQLTPVAELDGNNQIKAIYVYATKINVPDYIIKGGEKYKIITDHLGSIRYVVRVSDGAVVEQIEYDSFGNVLYDLNPGFVPFAFAGGLYDKDTGLVRFGLRDYDPEVGRWTSKDPILFYGNDSNLYLYCSNNPVNFIDVNGLSKCPENFEEEVLCEFFRLFKAAGYGIREFEISAWMYNEQGKIKIKQWENTYLPHMQKTKGSTAPKGTFGIVHTHPNRDTFINYVDKGTAINNNVCMYMIHRNGIWLFDPLLDDINSHGRQIYPENWFSELEKKCK